MSKQISPTHFNRALQHFLAKMIKKCKWNCKSYVVESSNCAQITWTYPLPKVNFVSTTFREFVVQSFTRLGIILKEVLWFMYIFSTLIKAVGIESELTAVVRKFPIMRAVSKTKTFAVSHVLILEILGSIN